MTWKQKTIIRILLIIAGMLCEDDTLRRQVGELATHVSVSKEEAP